jgi:hypothetical protein
VDLRVSVAITSLASDCARAVTDNMYMYEHGCGSKKTLFTKTGSKLNSPHGP